MMSKFVLLFRFKDFWYCSMGCPCLFEYFNPVIYLEVYGKGKKHGTVLILILWT